MSTEWKSYESELMRELRAEYPDAQISANQQRLGRYSKTLRQIDILVEGQIAGNRFSIVIDAKFYNRRVDVKGVDSFISMVQDIGAHKGLIITEKGFTKAAIARAFNDPHDIELDILSCAQLHYYQGNAALPYAGSAGVLIKSPFGWVIDATQYEKPLGPAHLYQRGIDLDEAFKRKELMYLQFWDRTRDGFDLDALLNHQSDNIKGSFPGASVEVLPTINRNDAATRLRLAKIPQYGDTREYTGFVEFKDFIFFVVLLTPESVAKRNVRKLESVMLSALPFTVRNSGRSENTAS